jgi:hypothetical protein
MLTYAGGAGCCVWAQVPPLGTQFTRITSIKVQILTQKVLLARHGRRHLLARHAQLKWHWRLRYSVYSVYLLYWQKITTTVTPPRSTRPTLMGLGAAQVLSLLSLLALLVQNYNGAASSLDTQTRPTLMALGAAQVAQKHVCGKD